MFHESIESVCSGSLVYDGAVSFSVLAMKSNRGVGEVENRRSGNSSPVYVPVYDTAGIMLYVYLVRLRVYFEV